MQRIVLATSNPGKVAEFQQLLAPFQLNVVPQSEFNLTSTEETGLTFVENAMLKARHAADKTGLPALADDSGLAIDALNGAPGIYSARYAGEDADFLTKCHKLLDELEAIPTAQRTARFHCILVYMQHAKDPAPLICQGIWEGRILTKLCGQKGFGYDPIFYVPTHHCSAAELEPAVKNQLSHRAQAFAALIKKLKVS